MSAPMRSSLAGSSAMSQQCGRPISDYLLVNNLHLLALHLANTLSQPMVCGKGLRKNCLLQTVYCGTSLIQKVQSRPKKSKNLAVELNSAGRWARLDALVWDLPELLTEALRRSRIYKIY